METTIKSLYIIGSLRNREIPKIAIMLRAIGIDAFDDWYSAGPEADDCWKAHQELSGRDLRQALKGYAAQNVLRFDKAHLDRTDGALLVMPAGKSGHLEAGYVRGLGKPFFILFDKEPERWDVMLAFATEVFFSLPEMLDHFKNLKGEA
jgi:hypothetical protein